MTGRNQGASPARTTSVGEIRFEFDIRRAEGAEANRLSLEQARVLWEVSQWLAVQRQSKPGQDRAA